MSSYLSSWGKISKWRIKVGVTRTSEGREGPRGAALDTGHSASRLSEWKASARGSRLLFNRASSRAEGCEEWGMQAAAGCHSLWWRHLPLVRRMNSWPAPPPLFCCHSAARLSHYSTEGEPKIANLLPCALCHSPWRTALSTASVYSVTRHSETQKQTLC